MVVLGIEFALEAQALKFLPNYSISSAHPSVDALLSVTRAVCLPRGAGFSQGRAGAQDFPSPNFSDTGPQRLAQSLPEPQEAPGSLADNSRDL